MQSNKRRGGVLIALGVVLVLGFLFFMRTHGDGVED